MCNHRARLWTFALLALLAPPGAAYAHVKWFSKFSYAEPPRLLGEVLTPLFFGLALLSMIAIGALVIVDPWMQRQPVWQRVQSWLARRKDQSTMVMRVATGASLLLSWQAGSMLVPELHIEAEWIGWYQFVLALLLIFARTTPLAGVGLGLLYLFGAWRFGPFYMLDYAHYIGAAAYLALSEVRSVRIRAIRLPLLYATVGFSLFWLALEKLVYPGWALYVLEQNPRLSLGFPPEFFIMGAAFVELTLGYLLIIGLLERPLAFIITLVFFSTTMVFGKIEVIGHTTVHAALIVFLLQGPGTVYSAPITFHRRLPLRLAFGAFNFALALALLLPLYTTGAWFQHRRAIEQPAAEHHHGAALSLPAHDDTVLPR